MIDVLSPVNTLVSGELNHRYARDEMKRQHHYNKEYMALSFGYGQAEQQNSAANTKRGLQMAGLSPALASEGMFAPASGPNAPAVSNAPNRAPKMDSMFTINDILGLQNLKAQTDNIKANTESTEIKNAQERASDEVGRLLAESFFDKFAESAKNPKEKAYFQSLGDTAKNKGSYQLISSLIDNMDKAELYNVHYQEYLVKRLAAEYQLDTAGMAHDIIKDMAELPSKQWEQLHSIASYYLEYVKNLKKQSDLSDAEKNLKLSQLKLTEEQIEQVKAVTSKLKNTDIMKMIDDGEYLKAALATIIMLFGNIHASTSL